MTDLAPLLDELDECGGISFSASIHPTAEIGENNTICDGAWIGPNVVIGNDNYIGPYACIGTPGQYRGRESTKGLVIGNNNYIRDHALIKQGIDQPTYIGDDCDIGSGVNIDHDCVVEDGVTICANAALGGDVHIMKHATIGMGASVHQGQTIGAYAMLGMGSVVPKEANILPGEKFAGNPARHLGRNLHALKKHKIRDLRDDEIRYLARRPQPKPDLFKSSVLKLQEYMSNRDRGFQGKRYEILRNIITDLPYLHENDAANVYNMAISLCWQQQEDFKADQIFIRELLIDAITGGAMPPKGDPKGKVGWLLNHVALGTYAPYKHVHAYLSGMEPCELIVHGNIREQEARQLMEYGHNLHHVKGTCEGVTEAIGEICTKTGIGALISDIYTAIPLWAYMKRVAPLQCYLSPGFQLFPADLVLLPETQEPLLNVGAYEFIPTVVLKEHLYQPVARKKPGKRFGILSRAEKCSRQYLETVQKVLDRTGGTFHFFGRGELDIQDPRFTCHGIKNAHEALGQIDVYLDSFPTCSGLSAFEAMAHGVPVVTLDHPSVHSWNQFKPCVVTTEIEYLAKAEMALGKEGERIATEGREIVASRLTNVPRAVDKLYATLTRHGWQK